MQASQNYNVDMDMAITSRKKTQSIRSSYTVKLCGYIMISVTGLRWKQCCKAMTTMKIKNKKTLYNENEDQDN